MDDIASMDDIVCKIIFDISNLTTVQCTTPDMVEKQHNVHERKRMGWTTD
jgi:hypothetical protein